MVASRIRAGLSFTISSEFLRVVYLWEVSAPYGGELRPISTRHYFCGTVWVKLQNGNVSDRRSQQCYGA
jgi:hypothetical protein